MNILSAIYAGKTGFLKASQKMAQRSHNIANMNTEPVQDKNIAEDIVGMSLDKLEAKANFRTFQISNDILHEMINLNKK